MGNLKKWYQAEATKKAVFEGLYPVMITNAKTFTKEAEKDGKTIQREVVTITFQTLQEVPFPDKSTDKIIIEQNYYFDVQMHQNALNGLGRAFGISQLEDTSQFEGKTGVIGIINREYQNNEGETKVYPQFGWGLFSYGSMNEKAQVEYVANEVSGKPTDEEYKEWFKNHLANYKI